MRSKSRSKIRSKVRSKVSRKRYTKRHTRKRSKKKTKKKRSRKLQSGGGPVDWASENPKWIAGGGIAMLLALVAVFRKEIFGEDSDSEESAGDFVNPALASYEAGGQGVELEDVDAIPQDATIDGGGGPNWMCSFRFDEISFDQADDITHFSIHVNVPTTGKKRDLISREEISNKKVHEIKKRYSDFSDLKEDLTKFTGDARADLPDEESPPLGPDLTVWLQNTLNNAYLDLETGVPALREFRIEARRLIEDFIVPEKK